MIGVSIISYGGIRSETKRRPGLKVQKQHRYISLRDSLAGFMIFGRMMAVLGKRTDLVKMIGMLSIVYLCLRSMLSKQILLTNV